MIENIKIRKAELKDVTIILNLIKELAEYEKLLDEVTATEDKLMNTIFGKDKFVEVWLAEINDEPVGQVLFFRNLFYISWQNPDFILKTFMYARNSGVKA